MQNGEERVEVEAARLMVVRKSYAVEAAEKQIIEEKKLDEEGLRETHVLGRTTAFGMGAAAGEMLLPFVIRMVGVTDHVCEVTIVQQELRAVVVDAAVREMKHVHRNVVD
jgi:hypothetical protein